MWAGETVARRFLIEREAGAGGMGRVFQAHDQQSGRTVALKLLRADDPDARERFEREARILSALSHPAIVGYVAHGTDDGGRAFLAMEWLAGAPLSARLKQGALPVEATVQLGLRVAEALACAHEAGVLHRDVKPSNLILDDGPSASDLGVRVVDFGVARSARETRAVTRTGMIVGSCAYMSPEQALAQRDVDARSDLFSLGCVLYECATGVRAFGARDATASLAKVLLDEPAPLRDLAPAAPRALAELVAWLLKKDRAARPASARVVVERLRALRSDAAPPEDEPAPAAALGTRERRVAWVVLVSSLDAAPETDDATIVDALGAGKLRALVDAYGGSLAFLADGTAIATFAGGVPTDEAPRAARCALAIRDELPAAAAAVAMGRSELAGAAPIGDAIDAAAEALRRTPAGSVRLHGVDPEWLSGFEIERDEFGLRLAGRGDRALGPRTLLGRPTVCVGRERELALLEGLFDDAVSEPQAKVALVTAAAGTGKSRLRHELLERLARRDAPPVTLVGRCDALGAGTPFAAVADAVRRHAGIAATDDEAEQRRKIVACACETPVFDRRAAAALLGELAGVSFPDDSSEALRAARGDSRLMGDHLRAAFEGWLASFGRPVVLVLEDLQWGDVPSVRVVDSALRNLATSPLFVLALARPEASELFPNLWPERGLVSVTLAPLGRRAAETLARDALGERVTAEHIASLVERAQGNAFFLEELLRASARGEASVLPDSIASVLQTRLDGVAPEARRALRAASILGEEFSADDARALLGEASARAQDDLDALVRAEILARTDTLSYRFRHALLRDATYETLTDADRALGHRLAAERLERAGGAGTLALAEHFVRGGAPERAALHLCAAATKALAGNDLHGAVALAERALALAPARGELGMLHATCAEAYRWLGDYGQASAHSVAAIDALDEGTVRWFFAIGEFLATCVYRRDRDGAAARLAQARGVTPDSREARNAQIVCVARGCTQLLEGARLGEADALTEALRALPEAELDDNALGWTRWFFAMRSLHDGDVITFARNTEACLSAFERSGEVRNTSSQRVNLGYAYAELGAYERAEPLLRRVLRDAERVGLPMVCAYALQNLGNVLRGMGRLEDGLEQEHRAASIGASIGDRRIEGAALSYAALMSLELGDPDAAERDVTRALEALDDSPSLMGFVKAVAARVHLARGRDAEAEESSREALGLVADGVEDGETFIRLTRLEVLEATGEHEPARVLAHEAVGRLHQRAAGLKDVALRQSFLERVAESRSTLELAARLGAA